MTRYRIREYLPLKPAPAADRAGNTDLHDARLERLLDRLPDRWRSTLRRLLHPSARWARIPAAVLLILGGLLSILPILGLWMLPLGFVILSIDVPFIRRWWRRLLVWWGRRKRRRAAQQSG